MSDTREGDVTVVLVHGAFADGASWAGVTQLLQDPGVPGLVPPIALRGIAFYSAYLRSVIEQLGGPVEAGDLDQTLLRLAHTLLGRADLRVGSRDGRFTLAAGPG